MKTVTAAWLQYWFARSWDTDYGVFRILFVLGIAAYLLEKRNLIREHLAFPSEFGGDSFLLNRLPLRLPPPKTVMKVLGLILILMAGAGIFTRFSLAALTLWYFYLFCYVSSFGIYSHSSSLPGLILLLMPFFPGIDAHSVDSWLRHPIAAATPLPVWPVRYVLITLSLFYFSTGLAKIRYGSTFLSGSTLDYLFNGPKGAFFTSRENTREEEKWRDGIGLEAFVYDLRVKTRLSDWLGKSRKLLILGSVCVFAWEITFPAVLLDERLLPIYLALGCLFHLLVYLTTKLSFMSFVFIYTLFIDWRIWAEIFSRASELR